MANETDESWLLLGTQEDPGVTTAPVAPVVPAAPAPTEAETPIPVAVTPAAAATPPVVPTPPEAKPVDVQPVVTELQKRQAETDQRLETLLTKLTEKPEVQLSAEELEAKAAQEREAILADPSKHLKELETKLAADAEARATVKVKEELAVQLGYGSVRDMEVSQASVTGVRNLTKAVSADGKPAYPLMANDAFRAEMAKNENLDAVFSTYEKSDEPVKVLRSRQFWDTLYNRVALAHATKAQAPASEAAATGDEPIIPVTATPAAVAAGAASGSDSVWAEIEAAGSGGLK